MKKLALLATEAKEQNSPAVYSQPFPSSSNTKHIGKENLYVLLCHGLS